MNNLGVAGEKQAKQFLIKNKYKILKTNYVCPIGEIDIIAKQHDVIVFVEVKTRSNTNFGLPRESVTPHKQNKIRRVAICFLKQNKLENCSVRFDVIDILQGELTHIQNAF